MKKTPVKRTKFEDLPIPKRETRILTGLPGCKNHITEAVCVTGLTDADFFLRSGRAIERTDDNGRMIIYLDDAGVYHCRVSNKNRTVESQDFTNRAPVHQWLREWWPHLKKETSTPDPR